MAATKPDGSSHRTSQPAGTEEHPVVAVLRRDAGSRRYEAVLAMAITAFVFEMAAPDTLATRRIGALLQVGTLALALWASGSSRGQRRYAAGLAVAGVFAVVIGATGSEATEFGVNYLVAAALVGVASLAIIRGMVRTIREQQVVTLESILAVITVYLLFGAFFAFAYGACAELQAGAFFTNGSSGDHADYLYFSFTSLTTVGGNLSAAGGFGRSLEVMESLLGQLYLVTVVALLISNVRARS